MSKSKKCITGCLKTRVPDNSGHRLGPGSWQMLYILVYLMPTATTKGTAITPTILHGRKLRLREINLSRVTLEPRPISFQV